LWWSWVGYAWLTSVVNLEEGVVRLAIFAAMAALLVVALCVPGRSANWDCCSPAPTRSCGRLGGTAIYLLAHVAFRWPNVHRLSLQRLLCAALLVAIVPPALQLPALATSRRAGGCARGADRL